MNDTLTLYLRQLACQFFLSETASVCVTLGLGGSRPSSSRSNSARRDLGAGRRAHDSGARSLAAKLLRDDGPWPCRTRQTSPRRPAGEDCPITCFWGSPRA